MINISFEDDIQRHLIEHLFNFGGVLNASVLSKHYHFDVAFETRL